MDLVDDEIFVRTGKVLSYAPLNEKTANLETTNKNVLSETLEQKKPRGDENKLYCINGAT